MSMTVAHLGLYIVLTRNCSSSPACFIAAQFSFFKLLSNEKYFQASIAI